MRTRPTSRKSCLPELLQKVAAQGFMGALVPEEPYGGAGLDTISYTLLLRRWPPNAMSTALAVHVHNSLALRAILRTGSDVADASELVPEMVAGERLGAFALTEAGRRQRSRPAAHHRRARR